MEKRPLLRASIPSPYAGPQSQKVVYVSARTPFLAAVKRVEKLLRRADDRLVQSATQLVKHANGNPKKRNWNAGRDGRDEIETIAAKVEELKSKKRKTNPNDGAGEEVVLKGTGKAISKVTEMGLWFQQREEYAVRLQTGTVSSIDDISYEKDLEAKIGESGDAMETVPEASNATGDIVMGNEAKNKKKTVDDPGGIRTGPNGSQKVKEDRITDTSGTATVSETRIRKLGMLEVYVSLR